jgi:hypothetical protein
MKPANRIAVGVTNRKATELQREECGRALGARTSIAPMVNMPAPAEASTRARPLGSGVMSIHRSSSRSVTSR